MHYMSVYIYMHVCTCIHQTDTQTQRHTDTQTHRHTDAQTHRHTDTQTNRHTDTQTQGTYMRHKYQAYI